MKLARIEYYGDINSGVTAIEAQRIRERALRSDKPYHKALV